MLLLDELDETAVLSEPVVLDELTELVETLDEVLSALSLDVSPSEVFLLEHPESITAPIRANEHMYLMYCFILITVQIKIKRFN